MIIVSQLPQRAHSENPGLFSKWNCSRHPYLFQFWRIDIVVSSWVDNGGLLSLVCDLTQTAAEFLQNGEILYVKDGNNLYGVTGAVTGVIVSSVNITVETDIPFNGVPSGPGYFNILARENYYVEVEVLGTDPISLQQKSWGIARVSTNSEGFARWDVSGLLNKYVDKVNAFSYNQKNWIDPYVFGSFRFRYTGKWASGEESFLITDPNIFYFVDATKYLKNKYGQNLCDYVPFPNSLLTEKAKFLSDFNRPTYFVGYPFDLSVIIPIAFGSSIGMTANEEMFDINNDANGTQDEAMALFKADTVQRVKLKGGYNAQDDSVDFWLQGDSLPTQAYVETGYVDSDYVEEIAAIVVTPFRLTEKKRINIVEPCEKNPVYIAWRNSKGGWSYWLFGKYQEVNVNSRINGTYQQEPDDLEDAMHRELITSGSAIEKLTLFSSVPIDDISGFKFIESSPRVQMMLTNAPDPTWLTVQMSPKGIKYRNDGNRVKLQFDILMPELYTVPN